MAVLLEGTVASTSGKVALLETSNPTAGTAGTVAVLLESTVASTSGRVTLPGANNPSAGTAGTVAVLLESTVVATSGRVTLPGARILLAASEGGSLWNGDPAYELVVSLLLKHDDPAVKLGSWAREPLSLSLLLSLSLTSQLSSLLLCSSSSSEMRVHGAANELCIRAGVRACGVRFAS